MKKTAKKKSSGGFLDRLKKTVVGNSQDGMGGFVEDDSIDLDSGVIVIDDTPPDVTISASEVLRESTENESKEVRGTSGKVFVIDLEPFFKVMNTDMTSKLAKNLINFGENLLARAIGRSGTYTLNGQTQFLFRLSVDDVEGWKMASRIVNELGVNFLRDGFKPEEMLPAVLAMVDEKDAYNADGTINIEKALTARIPYEPEPERERDDSGPGWYYGKGVDPESEKEGPEWSYEEDVDPDAEFTPEWGVDEDANRSKSVRVNRGPERRENEMKVDPKKDHRKSKHGRRDIDNPNASVWYVWWALATNNQIYNFCHISRHFVAAPSDVLIWSNKQ